MYINCGKGRKKYEEDNFNLNTFIGVDEVGRGCLAGPVVAAAVFIDKNQVGEIDEVNDSKMLSSKKRNKLYFDITSKYKYSVGIVESKAIDKINILKASLLAMQKSIKKINLNADIILVDGLYKIPNINRVQKTEIKGDQRFYSIAAASIVAKVYRDDIMRKYSVKYPNFSFNNHKGYGTKAHKNEIKNFGVLDIHRKSFKLN